MRGASAWRIQRGRGLALPASSSGEELCARLASAAAISIEFDAGLRLELLQDRPVGADLRFGDRLGDPLLELRDALRVDGVDARQIHRLDRLARRAFDCAQHVAFARRDEQDRFALASRPPGAADPVDVGLGIVGDIVVDDVADALDVEPSRGDVGRDQNVDLARFEARHGAFAQRLWNVAVQWRGREAARLELLGEFHGRLFGAREHQHPVEGFRFEDARQRVELVYAAHDPVALADVGRGAVLLLIVTSTGERRCFCAMRRIGAASVAENSAT